MYVIYAVVFLQRICNINIFREIILDILKIVEFLIGGFPVLNRYILSGDLTFTVLQLMSAMFP